jgi:uncharacterized protein YxjI
VMLENDIQDEHREDRSQEWPGVGGNHYQMRQMMVAIGDDFWIENDQGQKVYKVDGKALRIRKTLIFEDAHGAVLCKIQGRLLRIQKSMEIEGPNGEKIAMVKKALINLLSDRFMVKVQNGPDLDVQGNILDHEYSIVSGRDKIAEVSKKWFRLRDSYGVSIKPGHDNVLILAVAVCIDQMSHRGQ